MEWNGEKSFSSEEVAGMRIVFASLFLLPLQIFHASRFNIKKYFLPVFGMGLFGNLIPAFLFTAAETKINSSLAGMLNALTPLFTILIAVFIFRVKTNWRQITGIGIGFVGALMLMYFDGGKSGETTAFSYAMLVVAATLCYAISVNIIRRYLSDLNSVTAAVWAFTMTGPIALLYLLFNTEVISTLSETKNVLPSLSSVAVLGIAGSAISVIAFNTLIKNAGAVFASSVTYLMPIVAIVWGLSEAEPVAWQQVAAIGIILGAIYLINSKNGSTKSN